MGTLWKFLTLGPKAIATLWRLVKYVEQLDKSGLRKFSDIWWAQVRWDLEKMIVNATKGQDKGLRGLVQIDNQFLRGCGILLKSEAILRIYKAQSMLDRMKAEEALDSKLPAKSIKEWDFRVNGF